MMNRSIGLLDAESAEILYTTGGIAMSEKWNVKSLGSLCKFVRGPFGGSLKKSCFTTSGYAVYEQQHAIYDQFEDIRYFIDQSKYLEMRRFELFPGDLIMSCSGTMGKVAIVPDGIPQGIINQALLKLSPKKGVVVEFLKYWMSSPNFQNELIKYSQGVAIKNVASVKVLKEIQIFLPSPDEQKRIVAIVDQAFEAIDGAIENTKQNLANARELFESYLNSRLLAVVSGEVSQTLLCITDLIIDCEHKTAPTQEEGIPSIRTPNIGKGYLIFDDVYRVSEETYKLWTRRGKPEPGDLILAREAPAGNVGVIPPGAKVCLGQRTVLIRPKKQIIDSHYLAFLLLHPIVQKRLLDKSTGATVQHVNMKDIRALSMSELPSIQVQRDCVKELEHLKSEVNRLEAIYRQKLAALTELKQSILQKAFTGELTADQEAP
jgi:type I restriction enzyme, S subunit